jgi:hypothetical protein
MPNNKNKSIEMKIETISIQVYTCIRCDYRWAPEFELDHVKANKTDGKIIKPVACARCHSPYYDKQRKENGKKATV